MGWIAHLGVEGLIDSAVIVDWMPWLTRRLAPPSVWVIAIYYVALITFIRARYRSAALAVIAAALAIVMAPVFDSPTRRNLLRVTFLDVGQGDSAIVQFPDGRTLSVDAGGVASPAFDIAERVIAPAFWAHRRSPARLHEHHAW